MNFPTKEPLKRLTGCKFPFSFAVVDQFHTYAIPHIKDIHGFLQFITTKVRDQFTGWRGHELHAMDETNVILDFYFFSFFVRKCENFIFFVEADIFFLVVGNAFDFSLTLAEIGWG